MRSDPIPIPLGSGTRTLRAILISTVLLCLIAAADHFTPQTVSLSIFYLAPVAIAAWYGNRWMGLAVSLAAAVNWLCDDLFSGVEGFHPVWNAGVRFLVFAVVALLLARLRGILDREAHLADHDSLTGVLNSRGFFERLEEEISRSARHGHPFSLAYLDLDDFKIVNDTRGHLAGDALLRDFAGALRDRVRKSDVVARVGGDEFVLLFPETGPEGLGKALRDAREQLSRPAAGGGPPVRFSIGAVSFLSVPGSAAEAVKAADDTMYEVKQSGKDDCRLRIWPEPAAGS